MHNIEELALQQFKLTLICLVPDTPNVQKCYLQPAEIFRVFESLVTRIQFNITG